MKLNKNNFDEVKNGNKPVLVDFYADWCGPCRMLAPTLEEIAAERDDVIFCKVNVDNDKSLASEYGIVSIPTLVLLRGGEELARVTGVRPKEQILDLLDR